MDATLADRDARVTDFLNQQIDRHHIPGAIYVVVDPEHTLYSFHGGALEEDSVVMLNSTTKAIIAIAVMQLAEAQVIELDDAVSRHVPDCPYPDSLTVGHLLSHSGGVPQPMPLKWFHRAEDHDQYDESAMLARILADHPSLSFEPGEKYKYSNLGYWLLGEVIRNTSGGDLDPYLADHIRAPLDIPHDALTFDIPAPADMPQGHNPRTVFGWTLRVMSDKSMWGEAEGPWRRVAPIVHNGPAYGGLFGRVDGLIPIAQDLLADEPRLLSATQRDAMFTPQESNAGEPLGYSLGWSVGELHGARWLSKPGGGPGHFSNMRIYPDVGVATILLVNRTEVREPKIQALSDALDAQMLPD